MLISTRADRSGGSCYSHFITMDIEPEECDQTEPKSSILHYNLNFGWDNGDQ